MARPWPRLVVNLKTYPEATGRRAVALARAARRQESLTGTRIALAVQAVDVRACVAAGAHVYAQHVDRVDSSPSTGATRWESLLDAGVEGTLLNHSERRLDAAALQWCLERVARSRKASLVCAQDDEEARRYAHLRPSLLAVEPPELIGGDVSVTEADPAVVRRSVERVHEVDARLPVLCGAGVKDGRDAAAARRLGAHGILVASGVVKAARPERALAELARALAPK
jgi:triosephosphate isomerase (TIM)